MTFKWIAVPVFMLLAFVYSNEFCNSFRLNDRMKRLLYPYIGWTIIFYLFENIVRRVSYISVKELMAQFVSGFSFVPQFWYMLNLILLTIMWWGVGKIIDEKNKDICIYILFILGLYLQYSKVNYNFFILFEGNKYGRFELSYGRLFEMLPLTCCGLYIARYNKIIIVKNKVVMELLLLMGVILVAYIQMFLIPEGFGYGGLQKICLAVMLFFMAYNAPLDNIWMPFKKVIYILSKYSLGVYCVHYSLGRFIIPIMNDNYKSNIIDGTLFACVIIYCMSFLICVISCYILPKIFRRLCI